MPSQSESQTPPEPGELWLGRPPYLLIAQIVEVDIRGKSGLVSYELYDESGGLLERVGHAAFDDGWWRTFQPLARRYG